MLRVGTKGSDGSVTTVGGRGSSVQVIREVKETL